MPRLPMHDPRTVARDIPGIFDSIFPQLRPGIVAHFNRTAKTASYDPIPLDLVNKSSLQQAMLFEVGVAVGEALISGQDIDWTASLSLAVERQKKHFDAKLPDKLSPTDRQIAELTGRNIASMVSDLSKERGHIITVAPTISGIQWINMGEGDFSIGPCLIEVKCSRRNFGASDYRQLVMYWLLSFAASVETDSSEWDEGILLNPRSASYVTFSFDDFVHVISAGRTKVEVLQLFLSLVGTRDSL